MKILLFFFLLSYVSGNLPLPSSTSDPAMANYLTKMWTGYHRTLEIREEQRPAMNIKKDIIIFNDETFEDHIIEFDAILIFFHGKHCDKCKDYMAEYEDTAKDLIMYEPHISMGLMDCSGEGSRTCSKLRIPRMPWFKLFKQGQMDQDYYQSKNKKSMIKFMRNFFGSPIKKLRSVADVEDYLQEEEGSVIAFFNKKETELKEVYTKVAQDLHEIGLYFGYVTNATTRVQYKQYDNQIIVVRSKLLDSRHEDRIAVYNDPLDQVTLHNWMIKQQLGLMSFRTRDNEFLFKHPLTVIYINVILDFEYAPQATINTLKMRELFMKTAANYSSQMNFAISDKKVHRTELRNCGYSNEKITEYRPLICIYNDEDRFNMKMNFDSEAFSEAVDKFLDGRVQRYLKTEPVPDNDGKDVLDVVSTTMEEAVYNTGRDIFILFYKPDCSHCTEMMPTWMELGQGMVKEEIDILRMDMKANEIPPELKMEFQVKEYPTMFFKPADPEEHALQYVGKRSFRPLLQFVMSQASQELRSWDWRGRKKEVEEMKEDEEGIVIENNTNNKDEL